MDARVIEKRLEIEGRTFIVRKFDAFTGVKIGKLLVSKILPVFQSFIPMIGQILKDDGQPDTNQITKDSIMENVLMNLEEFLNLEGISKALDLISPEDLDYIMRQSLMACFELLGEGQVNRIQVMNSNGAYGVQDMEFDALLVLRLVCEAVLWGESDFFTAGRLASLFNLQLSSSPLNPLT